MIVYGPAKGLALTMSASASSLSAGKTLWSTIGPAGLDSTCGNVWSFAALRWKTTVVGSGASVEARFDRSDEGPLPPSAPLAPIACTRSNENLTSVEVRSSPLANLSPGLSFTVYVFGSVNDADAAMSGLTSGLP